MKRNLLAVTFLFLTAMAIPDRAKAPPPPEFVPQPPLPGKYLGAAANYWRAPYVEVSEDRIGSHNTETVTWFSEDGSVKKQMQSHESILKYADPGYIVSTTENGQEVIHGLAEPWRCALPKRPVAPSLPDLPPAPGFPMPQAATLDGRTLIDTFNPGKDELAYDVYVHGVLANTVGPFVGNQFPPVKPNSDGSTAIGIWEDATKTIPQIVCADPNGKIQFRVDCGGPGQTPVLSPNLEVIAAPDGAGALLKVGFQDQHKFTLYTRTGKGPTVQVGFNSRCIGWVPATLKSLFETSIGYDARYRMIDWETGKILWDVHQPEGMHVTAAGITSKLVIFTGAELYRGGPWRGSGWMLRELKTPLIRAMIAVSAEDGHFVSHWRGQYPGSFAGYDDAYFVQMEKKLILFTPQELTELSEEDILSARNGWTR